MTTIILDGTKIKGLGVEEKTTLMYPELAEALLDQHNDNVRNYSPKQVKKLTREMKAGRWREKTGDVFIMDEHGRIKDGQHRLMACIKSGISFNCHIRYSNDDQNLDQHVKTKFSDILKKGHKNAPLLATATRVLYRYETNEKYKEHYAFVARSEDATNQMRNNFFTRKGRGKKLEESLKFVLPRSKNIPIAASYLTALHYIMSDIDKTLIENMISTLANPVESYKELKIVKTDPIRSLRKFFDADIKKRPEKKASLQGKVARFIKTWNCWRAGDKNTTENSNWGCVGPNPEKFPRIA